MNRRGFMELNGMSAGAFKLPTIPVLGGAVSPEALLDNALDVAIRKRMADTALNAAKSKGAAYADICVGRYLNQFAITRDNKVQNQTNTE